MRKHTILAIVLGCLMSGFMFGYTTGSIEGARAFEKVKEQKNAATDSLEIYREFADRAITLLEALGIDDDSVDPYYDGDDAKAFAVSMAYKRYCEIYNKLAGIDTTSYEPLHSTLSREDITRASK